MYDETTEGGNKAAAATTKDQITMINTSGSGSGLAGRIAEFSPIKHNNGQ